MIRIDRARHDEHGVPIRPPKAWFELAKTWTDNALREQKAHKANGKVYHHNAVHACVLEGRHDMAQQWQTRHLVQNLGQRGFHPCPLTGGKNYRSFRHDAPVRSVRKKMK